MNREHITKLPDIPIIGEKHGMKVTLSRMKSGEYRFCARRIDVSLYYSYTMWKSRVCSRTSRLKGFIDFIDRSILIERYLYIFMWYIDTFRRTNLYYIQILISRRCICISGDRSKSITHCMIPVWRSDRRHFSWYCLGRVSRFWPSKRRKVIHRAVYTSENKKREECTEPFLLSILTLSRSEMFHKLYKKSKLIIAYIFSFVNIYFIKWLFVKYQLFSKSGFFESYRYIHQDILVILSLLLYESQYI